MKRMLINKSIDYATFDKHVISLLSKGYIEIIYPFEEIRLNDSIELTIWGKEAPIYKKGRVTSYSDQTINTCEEIMKVDIVRLFRKQALKRNALLKDKVHQSQ